MAATTTMNIMATSKIAVSKTVVTESTVPPRPRWWPKSAPAIGRPVLQVSRVPAPDLHDLCEAWLLRVVGDFSAVEPAVDHVGELARVAEVHGVRRALDDRDRQVRRRQAADLPYPPRWRHERVTGADHGERGDGRSQDAFERGESHELAEQLQGVYGAEVQIVGEHDASHPRFLAPRVARELQECPGEWLVLHPTRGRGEHDAGHAFGCAVRDLQGHRAAHRVADQDHALETECVENVEERPGQRRDSQSMAPGCA